MEIVKGYKTIALAAIVALTGFFASPEVTAWAGENSAVVGSGLAVLIAGLRAMTTSAMFKK